MSYTSSCHRSCSGFGGGVRLSCRPVSKLALGVLNNCGCALDRIHRCHYSVVLANSGDANPSALDSRVGQAICGAFRTMTSCGGSFNGRGLTTLMKCA